MVQLMTTSTSLLNADGAAMDSAARWVTGVIGGTVATSLCIIAVAMVGFLMLSGQLAVRRGFAVVIGCFLLLGAPVLAATLQSAFMAGDAGPDLREAPNQPLPESPPPVASRYRGASSRRD
jgi:type IV secretion system protein VirB2